MSDGNRLLNEEGLRGCYGQFLLDWGLGGFVVDDPIHPSGILVARNCICRAEQMKCAQYLLAHRDVSRILECRHALIFMQRKHDALHLSSAHTHTRGDANHERAAGEHLRPLD